MSLTRSIRAAAPPTGGRELLGRPLQVLKVLLRDPIRRSIEEAKERRGLRCNRPLESNQDPS
jgi:hypothetical protein